MGTLSMERAFGSSAMSYGTSVFPSVTRELSRWRARAETIPDASLRGLAHDALAKRGNMQGAALFAVLAPRGARARVARALVAFQAAYNYLDTLAEQRSDDPVGNGRQLHLALLDALDPRAARGDYYALHPQREDGGYLLDMLDTARACLSALPSYALVAPSAQAAAGRIVDFQSLNHGERRGSHEGLERWARARTPADSDLRWWETAAAAGSSLGVHVLIGLAAQPELDSRQLGAIDRAYFPSIGALHSLLDSLVDVAEDERDGQRNLLSYCASPADAAARMGSIAARARAEARALGGGHRHEMILTAMTAHYLSTPEASAPEVSAIAARVIDAAGPLTRPARSLFSAARLGARHLPAPIACANDLRARVARASG